MTLEDFITLNLNAAVRLYKTGRMHLLTDDPYYLSGEATDTEAMVLLLQRQLSTKNEERLSRSARNHREVRTGLRPPKQRAGRFKGVTFNGRRYTTKAKVAGKDIWIGSFATDVEAARAFDAWVAANAPGRKTNAQLGLYEGVPCAID